MTGDELRAARKRLGENWGLGRPVSMTEMGEILRLHGADVGSSVRDYERGKTRISGPIGVAVELLLTTREPPKGFDFRGGR